jgi:hypothetical protein
MHRRPEGTTSCQSWNRILLTGLDLLLALVLDLLQDFGETLVVVVAIIVRELRLFDFRMLVGEKRLVLLAFFVENVASGSAGLFEASSSSSENTLSELSLCWMPRISLRSKQGSSQSPAWRVRHRRYRLRPASRQ